jgi:deoxyribonuclease V
VRFDIPSLDLEAELKTLLAQIPRGRVTTYGDLADALGLRTAARWVGEFLREHSHTDACACHRVVRKGGELGLYVVGREPTEKAERLNAEGVRVSDWHVERFDEFVFRDFRIEEPLARLIDLQLELAKRVELVLQTDEPQLAAGLDVSYSRDGMAIGACAVVERSSGRVVWTTTHRDRQGLPYIPSLLTFRELPMLLVLFEQARKEFPKLDLYFIDGNGILHPRGAGVATCFGVTADVPTIGVAKSFLCGRLESPPGNAPDLQALVRIDDRAVGAVLTLSQSSRPLYVSPGQKMDIASAARLTRAFAFGHRLPEPLYWADRLSRAQSRVSEKSHKKR